MHCCSEGELRAYLDRELPAGRQASVSQHLGVCGACQRRLSRLERLAATSAEALGRLEAERAPAMTAAGLRQPPVDGLARSGSGNWARVWSVWRDKMSRQKRVWRPLVAGLAAVVLLVGVFSLPTTRAFPAW